MLYINTYLPREVKFSHHQSYVSGSSCQVTEFHINILKLITTLIEVSTSKYGVLSTARFRHPRWQYLCRRDLVFSPLFHQEKDLFISFSYKGHHVLDASHSLPQVALLITPHFKRQLRMFPVRDGSLYLSKVVHFPVFCLVLYDFIFSSLIEGAILRN
ncbi:hypothetical protein SK128_020679 [Halocaridina rubra]|uniref:Uncharacterized protein n=1 Tax=Halocaridina rubra TaxID=373956 RepID=A0AAN9A3D2_HALRR